MGLVLILGPVALLSGCHSSSSNPHSDTSKASIRASSRSKAQVDTPDTSTAQTQPSDSKRLAKEAPFQRTNPAETPTTSVATLYIHPTNHPNSEPSSSEKGSKQSGHPHNPSQKNATIQKVSLTEEDLDPISVEKLCKEIGDKLGSISIQDCLASDLKDSGGRSVLGRSLAVRDFLPQKGVKPLGKVLFIGGIHGDEYSSVSIVFKWINTLRRNHSGVFQWRMIPLSNPDGLLRGKSQRQNHAGVDLNRNFPTPNWKEETKKYWETSTYKNPRRYPGPTAASEPETRWIISQIEEFEPDAIVSVHAPYSLVDYDGPQTPPEKLGSLQLLKLGIYPGSLGNYAGINRKIPVVTIELASAGIMPPNSEIKTMWLDLVKWLKSEVPKQRLAKTN